MRVGVPKEIKESEGRVAVVPAGVHELSKAGHVVYVERTAGTLSGFSDEQYRLAGAVIVEGPEAVYEKAEMIVKVKEPLEREYAMVRAGQIVFTFFHFASSRALTTAMVEQKAVCMAYETVEREDGTLPLLVPMSEVAGRMSVQHGAKYLEKQHGGYGLLLGGVPGVMPAKVLVIGSGTAGTEAAKMAAGLGADVTLLDKNLFRLRHMSEIMPANVNTLISNPHNVRMLVRTHHLIIGAVLVPGSKAPKVITEDMLAEMQAGTVMVDVSVDQGGCFETTRLTTHKDPVYEVNGVLHYCVANIPGSVPHTSTLALTNATLPYVLQVANLGWRRVCAENRELRLSLNIADRKIIYKGVADAFGLYDHYEPFQ